MTILLTGSSRGIGAAIHRALTDAGASVIGHGTASGIPADFADPAGPTALWNAALEQAGGEIDRLGQDFGKVDDQLGVLRGAADGFSASVG